MVYIFAHKFFNIFCIILLKNLQYSHSRTLLLVSIDFIKKQKSGCSLNNNKFKPISSFWDFLFFQCESFGHSLGNPRGKQSFAYLFFVPFVVLPVSCYKGTFLLWFIYLNHKQSLHIYIHHYISLCSPSVFAISSLELLLVTKCSSPIHWIDAGG